MWEILSPATVLLGLRTWTGRSSLEVRHTASFPSSQAFGLGRDVWGPGESQRLSGHVCIGLMNLTLSAGTVVRVARPPPTPTQDCPVPQGGGSGVGWNSVAGIECPLHPTGTV